MTFAQRITRAVLASLAVAACFAAPTAHADGAQEQLTAYTNQVENAWAAHVQADGKMQDILEPAYGNTNYGTVMFASAALTGAQRTGNVALQEAAIRHLGTLPALRYENNLFWSLGAQEIIRSGNRGLISGETYSRVAPIITAWSANLSSETHNCMANPSCYSNQRLVQSFGELSLVANGVIGGEGTSTPSAEIVRARADYNINTLMVNNAGPIIRTTIGRAQALSDPKGQPNAYHLLSLYLLQRINDENPGLLSKQATAIMYRAQKYALALMAPDGQLTFSGRSMDQSWVLAAAAAIGARNTAAGGKLAPVWQTFRNRAAARLMNVNGALPDGTIPVVPGLHQEYSPFIMDGYASMTQYNGLTLWLLEDALSHWSKGTPASLPMDTVGASISDIKGSGLVWRRQTKTWWAISATKNGKDQRTTQGLVGFKTYENGSWRSVIGSRPIDKLAPNIAWTVGGRKVTISSASDTAKGTVLSGKAGGNPVKVLVSTSRGRLLFDNLEKKSVHIRYWAADAATGLCRTSSSGRICLRSFNLGNKTVSIG